MGKNGTSRGREKSWNGKLRKLGPNARSLPYDPSITLRDPKFIQQALLEALQAGDFETIITIYRAHLRVLNRTHAASALHVSRQYVHKMLKPSNTPSLRTFASFMRLLAREAPGSGTSA